MYAPPAGMTSILILPPEVDSIALKNRGTMDRRRLSRIAWAVFLCGAVTCQSQFVRREGPGLFLRGKPFRFVGANAYGLARQAARGDTAGVLRVLDAIRAAGGTVLRTWGFNDGGDSTDASVIQVRPGAYNETGLRGLDYVLWQAGRHSLRVILPLVNSWDDFGGMNKYVAWRMAGVGPPVSPGPPDTAVVRAGDRSFRVMAALAGKHDDFYTDPVIRAWYAAYTAMLVGRVNAFTGIAYRRDTTLLAWELANEPRSADRSGMIVRGWLDAMGGFLKGEDADHLVGSGEEGFDVTAAPYREGVYGGQTWLFDGSAGVSFSLNAASPSLDFASIHLYPESWSMPGSAGGDWIRDHLRVASLSSRPLVLGEFAVRVSRVAVYDSWLSSALYDGAAGAVVWQFLDDVRGDPEGYGITCPDPVCDLLAAYAQRFSPSVTPGVPIPPSSALLENYPNPLNRQTTLAYTLPRNGRVVLDVWTLLGSRVAVLVDGPQGAGRRKELLDARDLSSGVYICRLRVEDDAGGFAGATRVIVIR
jgi:mannan endo-1,4-beta-mannosidase